MKIHFIKNIAIGSVLVGLTACSLGHKNPLSEINSHDAGHFLVDASHYAEKKMSQNNFVNHGYEKCMDRKVNDTRTCQTLYSYMLEFAKTKPLFKTLTYAQLTDFDVWQSLKDEYDNYAFVFVAPDDNYHNKGKK